MLWKLGKMLNLSPAKVTRLVFRVCFSYGGRVSVDGVIGSCRAESFGRDPDAVAT